MALGGDVECVEEPEEDAVEDERDGTADGTA